MRSAGSKAVAALLAVCKELQLDAVERLKALSLFCDRFIPVHQCDFRKSDSESFSMLSSVLPSDRPFLFSAVGCILVHVCSRHRICVSGSDLEFVVERENLIQVYKAASKVIGPGFDVSFSSGDLQRAAEEIRKLVRNLTRERDSADFLQIFFVQLEHAGLKAFGQKEFHLCCDIFELMYDDGGVVFKGAIEKGGKLTAAAVISAAFAISAPTEIAEATLPFLTWLSELSHYPKDVIKVQAAVILQHIMK